MNDRDLELADQCTAQEFSDCTGFSETFDKAKFADLIRADEREACAKVCETGVDYEHPTVKGHIMENFGHSRLLAKAIRARGDK